MDNKKLDPQFPIPTTASSIEYLNTYWKAMCLELKLPYFPNATDLEPMPLKKINLKTLDGKKIELTKALEKLNPNQKKELKFQSDVKTKKIEDFFSITK